MPQYIIDAHTHIFPRKIAAKAASSIGEFYSLDMQFDGMTHELLEEGDRCGVALFLVCSVATKAEQVSSINDFVASKVNLHPDRLLVTFNKSLTLSLVTYPCCFASFITSSSCFTLSIPVCRT